MAKSGISRLLIESAMDADVFHRLLETPEETFDEYRLSDEERDLLRHPDQRLLRLFGAILAQENAIAAAGVATTAAPPANSAAPPTAAPAGKSTASAPLPDISLVLTLVPCALYENGELRNFAFATWVSPLAEGVDPDTLPPPPGTVLPGTPLPPLRAIVRVSAIQLQDAAGNLMVGLSAALIRSTNMFAPPPAGASGDPAASGRDLSAADIQAAIAGVRGAPAEARYGKLVELLRVLHPEVAP